MAELDFFKKVENFDELMELLEALNQQIDKSLSADNIKAALNAISKRMPLIAQIKGLTEIEKITDAQMTRFNKIWESNSKMMEKVKEQKKNISSRLKSHRKVASQYRKLVY